MPLTSIEVNSLRSGLGISSASSAVTNSGTGPASSQDIQDLKTQATTAAPPTAQKSNIGQNIVSGVKDIASNVGSDFANNWNDMTTNISEANQGRAQGVANNSAAGQGNNFAQGGLAIPSMIGADIWSPINQTIKSVFNAAVTPEAKANLSKGASAVMQTPQIQSMVQGYQNFAKNNPQEAKIFNEIVNTASIIPGVQAGSEALGAGKALVKGAGDVLGATGEMAAGAVKGAKEVAGNAIEGTKNAIGGITGNIAKGSGEITDAIPSFDEKMIKEPNVKDATGKSVPRVNEAEGLGKRTVNPTTLEKQANAELGTIKDYPKDGTNLQKYQAVKSEITNEATTMRTSLGQEKAVMPREATKLLLENAVNKAADESLTLSNTDPIIKKYLVAANKFVDNNPENLTGTLNVKQGLDEAYKVARGRLAFNDAKVTALDEIHTAARNELTQQMTESAKSTAVKAMLKRQFNLYNAADVLGNKAEAEGNSLIERVMTKHPVATKVIKAGAKAVKLGGVIKGAEMLK